MNLDGQIRKVILVLVRNGVDFQQACAEFKLKYMEEALKLNDGNIKVTAEKLGVHRNTIGKLIKKRNDSGKRRSKRG
jgi:DNA-binding NtrC family response regulator